MASRVGVLAILLVFGARQARCYVARTVDRNGTVLTSSLPEGALVRGAIEPGPSFGARKLDQLGCPVAGDVDGVEPLDRGDTRARLPAYGELDAIDAPGSARHEIDPGVTAIARLCERAHIPERLGQRLRVERDHTRAARQRAGNVCDLLVGDGADRT